MGQKVNRSKKIIAFYSITQVFVVYEQISKILDMGAKKYLTLLV